MGKFTDLKVWIRSRDLALRIYQITNDGPVSKDFGMRDQLRRAAVSVASNIAEGDELNSDRQSIKHLYIARGSLAELRTQIHISYEIGYFDEEDFKIIDRECKLISSMISSLIIHRTLTIVNDKKT